MRFHVPGLAHTVSTPEYSACAFTTKVVKLCKMLKMLGHEVIHYGHRNSIVECDQHVTVTNDADLHDSYPDHDWRTQGFPKFALTDSIYRKFNKKTIAAIGGLKRPNDFLLCSFGHGHKALADAHPDLIVVEPGIGYPSGGFAPFRIFESYAIMHAYQGTAAIGTAGNAFWYDKVIPNYFDHKEFGFSDEKEDYFLFLGRVNAGKGIHIAQQLAIETGTPLVVAGAGDFVLNDSPLIRRVGVVAPATRKTLLAKAKATICASTFVEPFCGVQIESFMSGTPVISSDRGAFAEYNVHGVTGFRCSTFEQFLFAAHEVKRPHRIDYTRIEDYGYSFTLNRIAPYFDEYFKTVYEVKTGKGWYARRPNRESLDFTTFQTEA